MKKLGVISVLLVLTILLAVPAAAASASSSASNEIVSHDTTDMLITPTHWQITLRAQVVSNKGDKLVVWLASPDRMKTEEGDKAQNLQEIPINSKTTVVDAQGKPIHARTLLPGQQIVVKFVYYWQGTAPNREESMVRAVSVAVQGELRLAKSTATVDDFEKDSLVATVLAVEKEALLVYVEAGRVFTGKIEYISTGRMTIPISPTASIKDTLGNTIKLSAIKPMQRVVLSKNDSYWLESYPPRYVPTNSMQVTLLADGDKIFSSDHLASLQHVTASVVKSQTDSSGMVKLIVTPDPKSREAKYCSQYLLFGVSNPVYDQNGDEIAFGDIPLGATIQIDYNGINYQKEPGEIPWYNRIVVVG